MPSLRKLPHNIHNKRERENLTAKKEKKKEMENIKFYVCMLQENYSHYFNLNKFLLY